jgi:hypothetical protein
MKFLSNKLGIKIRCDFMLNYFWIDTWNFLIRPGKNVIELFEKIHVNLNLMRGKSALTKKFSTLPGFREMLMGIVLVIVSIFPSA